MHVISCWLGSSWTAHRTCQPNWILIKIIQRRVTCLRCHTGWFLPLFWSVIFVRAYLEGAWFRIQNRPRWLAGDTEPLRCARSTGVLATTRFQFHFDVRNRLHVKNAAYGLFRLPADRHNEAHLKNALLELTMIPAEKASNVNCICTECHIKDEMLDATKWGLTAEFKIVTVSVPPTEPTTVGFLSGKGNDTLRSNWRQKLE